MGEGGLILGEISKSRISFHPIYTIISIRIFQLSFTKGKVVLFLQPRTYALEIIDTVTIPSMSYHWCHWKLLSDTDHLILGSLTDIDVLENVYIQNR